MDKHKRLFDLLPEEERPEGIQQLPCGEWEFDKCPSSHIECNERIELAAIKWLMGRASIRFIESRDDDEVVIGINYRGTLFAGYTIIDALLAAVEREASSD